ncbi:hypothetical protein [Actinoplanes siamensis]|uniref:Uncharacterized protein n=1 Tax=Actinoplanes siamensis TaxID=1223317 RepID=A0A919N4X9_9ACTN|nr:hypothetical protein [Actinoplanes siamensis]GIF04466.1 hypothetical protein Asi03nite_20040 [Actinoplanes siamensis]
MKIGTPANYYVRAMFSGWDYPPEEAHLHEGCWTVDLNHGMTVAFIDGLDHLGPPWVEASLPPEEDGDLQDPDMVRLLTLLQSTYTVTPNDELAGGVDRFPLPWPTEDRVQGVVFYLTRAEFAPLLDDIKALSETNAGSVQSTVRRDEVLDHPVIRFIEERVLTSRWLTPRDAHVAGLSASGS